MAAFDLAVMPWRIWANQLMTNTKLGGGLFKQRLQVAFAVAEPIREFKAVMGLYALHLNALSFEEGICLLQKIRRGIGALLFVSTKIAQAAELVDGGILEQPQTVDAAGTGNHLDVDLYTLPGVSHLLVRLGSICFLFRLCGEITHALEHTIEAFHTPRVPALPQSAPQIDDPQLRVPTPHIPYELKLRLRMLRRMGMWPFGTVC